MNADSEYHDGLARASSILAHVCHGDNHAAITTADGCELSVFVALAAVSAINALAEHHEIPIDFDSMAHAFQTAAARHAAASYAEPQP